ncbi:hypothetical protein BaRGS_00040212, partial [Batillaria attramentaria]
FDTFEGVPRKGITGNMLGRRLHIFPIIMALYLPVAFLITYGMAVYSEHVKPVFPYISDTGTIPPESCVFGQLLNVYAALSAWCMYLRYKQVRLYYRYIQSQGVVPQSDRFRSTRRKLILNKICLVIGIVAALGVSVVGNFQEDHVISVHLLGATMAFGGAGVYCWMQAIISYKMSRLPNSGPWSRLARVVLSTIHVISLIIIFTFVLATTFTFVLVTTFTFVLVTTVTFVLITIFTFLLVATFTFVLATTFTFVLATTFTFVLATTFTFVLVATFTFVLVATFTFVLVATFTFVLITIFTFLLVTTFTFVLITIFTFLLVTTFTFVLATTFTFVLATAFTFVLVTTFTFVLATTFTLKICLGYSLHICLGYNLHICPGYNLHGYTEHLVATFAEWVMAFVSSAYFLTFVTELRVLRTKVIISRIDDSNGDSGPEEEAECSGETAPSSVPLSISATNSSVDPKQENFVPETGENKGPNVA